MTPPNYTGPNSSRCSNPSPSARGPVGPQGRTGEKGDPGEDGADGSDAAVNTTNIQAAMSADPEGARDAMGVDDFFFRPGITGLTGGGSGNLDGQSAAGYTGNQVLVFIVSGELEIYRVEASADVTDAPDVIRSSDHGTSGKVFRRVTAGLPPIITVDGIALSNTDGLTLPDKTLGYSDGKSAPVVHDGSTSGGNPVAMKSDLAGDTSLHFVSQESRDYGVLPASNLCEIVLATFTLPAGSVTVPGLHVGLKGTIRTLVGSPANNIECSVFIRGVGNSGTEGIKWAAANFNQQLNIWEFCGFVSFYDTSGSITPYSQGTTAPGGLVYVSSPTVTPAAPDKFIRSVATGGGNHGDPAVDNDFEIFVRIQAIIDFPDNIMADCDLSISIP